MLGSSDPDRPRTVEHRWQGVGAGARYASLRFGSSRKRGRDPLLVQRLLARHGSIPLPLVLDAPCGAGRLASTLAGLAGRVIGLDVSRQMLEQARSHEERILLQGNLFRLPLADRSFDAVVCCRLLHHFAAAADVRALVRELVRVSRGLVVASFWDAGSLPALAQSHLPSLGRRAPRRHALTRRELAATFEEAGAEVVGFAKSVPLVTRQCFVVARRRGGEV